MCIIAAKPAGVAMPDDKTINRMWANNNDGAGFMYAKDGKVHIQKGLMKLSRLKAALEELGKSIDLTATPMVMHFRITTHGGTKPENCHPFPITDSIGKLQKLKQAAPLGVAHNGVIHIYPRKGISDTMEYIASQLAPLSKAVPNFYKNPHLIEMIRNATDSKLAFLTGKGEIVTIGDFITDNGIQYSNSTYRYYTHFYDYPYSYTAWGSWKSSSTKKGKVVSLSGWCDDPYDTFDDDLFTDTDLSTSPADVNDPGYHYERLMWLAEGDYVRDKDGNIYEADCDFLIDECGRVYCYDEVLDGCIPCPDMSAYSSSGLGLWYDEDSPWTTEELVYDVDPYSLIDDDPCKN